MSSDRIPVGDPGHIEIQRTGRLRPKRWDYSPDGRTYKGYDLMAYRVIHSVPSGGSFADKVCESWVCGSATKNIDDWGRHRGWTIRDYLTGEILQSHAEPTIGLQLQDALWWYEGKLEEQMGLPT